MVQDTAIHVQWQTNSSSTQSIERRHFKWLWSSPNPHIKVMTLSDAQCLKTLQLNTNRTYTAYSKGTILSDLEYDEWLHAIFNDTKHGAVSLWQPSFLYVLIIADERQPVLKSTGSQWIQDCDLLYTCIMKPVSWNVLYGIEVSNVPLDTLYVMSEMIFPTNQLTGAKTDLPNQSFGWYLQNKYNYNQVTIQNNEWQLQTCKTKPNETKAWFTSPFTPSG